MTIKQKKIETGLGRKGQKQRNIEIKIEEEMEGGEIEVGRLKVDLKVMQLKVFDLNLYAVTTNDLKDFEKSIY